MSRRLVVWVVGLLMLVTACAPPPRMATATARLPLPTGTPMALPPTPKPGIVAPAATPAASATPRPAPTSTPAARPTAASGKPTAIPPGSKDVPPPGGANPFADIAVPPGARVVPLADWTVPPGAGPAPGKAAWRAFKTDKSAEELARFYQAEMPKKSWQQTAWLATGDFNLGSYTKEPDTTAQVYIPLKAGEYDLVLVVYAK